MTAVRILVLATLLGLTLLLPAAGDPVAATVLWLVCLFVLARSHPNGMLSFGSLYVLLLGIFHLGVVGPITLGITRATPPMWMASARLPSAIALVSSAMAAFTLGARLRAVPRGERNSLPPQPWLFLAGGFVALVGAAILWVGVRRLGVLSGGYAGYFERAMTEDVRLFGLGLMVFPIGVVVAAVGASRRQLIALGALVAVVLGPLFLAGFRGPVIVQTATLLAVWARRDRRVAHRLAIGIAALAIVLVPAVRITRDVRRDVTESIGAVDPLAVLLEAGGSLYPLVVTAERMQSGAEPLWLGRSYLTAVRRIVPNVGRPAGMEGRAESPNGWATLHANRWLYDHGGGIGFSGVAEPYLNFGTVGVVVVFILLGLVIQQWEHWLARDPFLGAIGAATFGFVLWAVRNEAMELFRSIAIATAVVAAAWLAHRFLRRRDRVGSALAAPPQA